MKNAPIRSVPAVVTFVPESSAFRLEFLLLRSVPESRDDEEDPSANRALASSSVCGARGFLLLGSVRGSFVYQT